MFIVTYPGLETIPRFGNLVINPTEYFNINEASFAFVDLRGLRPSPGVSRPVHQQRCRSRVTPITRAPEQGSSMLPLHRGR
jgi:hypothetical protein